MKLDVVAGSHNDEFYTPAYAILPLVPYLRSGARVWCPFDTEGSYFVRILRAHGYEVVATHLESGDDFFERIKNPPAVEYVVSNPPYSLKTEVLEALFESRLAFAMLVGVVGLFESQRRFDMFRTHVFELMYFNRRVSYLREYGGPPAINPPFSSVYVCSRVLPCPVVFEEVDKTKIHL